MKAGTDNDKEFTSVMSDLQSVFWQRFFFLCEGILKSSHGSVNFSLPTRRSLKNEIGSPGERQVSTGFKSAIL